MSDFEETDAPRRRTLVVQFVVEPIETDDDPRSLQAVAAAGSGGKQPPNKEAPPGAPEPEDEGDWEDGGFGGVPQHAKRNRRIEEGATEAVRDALGEENRQKLFEKRDESLGELINAASIQAYAAWFAACRVAWRAATDVSNWPKILGQDIKLVEGESDDKTPWWRFGMKLVIKQLERLKR